MNTLSAELLDMLEVVRALNFAAEEEGSAHWITLKNEEGAGTTHVKIDGGGNIEAGPKSLEGQNVEHIQKHPLYDKKTGQVFNQHKTPQTANLQHKQPFDPRAAEAKVDRSMAKKGPKPRGQSIYAKASQALRKIEALPPRTADTMSDAISMSSPNGRVSQRSKDAASKQLAEKLFGLGGGTREQITGGAPTPYTPQERAAKLREFARMAGPSQAKKLIAQAEELERQTAPETRAASKSQAQQPSREERLKEIASGHPDNESVQAAKQLLEKSAPAAEQKQESPAAPPSGMKTGLFGQSFIDSSGVGEQKPLFHQPVEYNKPDTAEFKKFKEQDTPSMFLAKGEGAPKEPSNVEPAGQPDKNDRREVERDNRGSAESIDSAASTGANGDGAGNGPTEPPEKPVASGTPDEPERDGGSEPAVQPGGAERGHSSAGTEGAEPDSSVAQSAKPSPQSEQDIAQAVNRGEMSVEDVLPTHPHLAGDALIEQHKRERDAEMKAAEQAREEAEHAQGSEADLPEGDLPDFGDVEGDQPAAEPESETAPAMQEATPEPPQQEAPQAPARQPARSNKAPSRGAIEKMLLDNLSAIGGGYTAQDEHELNEAAGAGNPFTFHKEIPAEVKEFIAGHPEAAGLRKLFRVTNNPAEAGGADAFGQLGDRYLNIAEAKAGTPIRQALQEAKNSPDPQVRLLAAIYDLPKGEIKGKPQSVNPQKLETGSQFTIKGVPVEVAKDDQGHRVLKDGGELPEVPIDAITEALPVDKGSMKPGKPAWAEQKPAEQPAANVDKPSAEAPAAPSEPQEQAKAPEPAPTPESAPASPQAPAETAPPSPEQLQADVQNGLAVLGINPRQAETLARAAIQMGNTSVVDAIKWALKNPTAKPQAAPSLQPSPSPAARVDQHGNQVRTGPSLEQQAAAALAGSPPGGMQAVRQRAKTTPPPSNLPPLQHQAPPPTVPRKASHSSALAASKPVHTGGPKQHVPAAPHLPHGRAAHSPAAPPVSRFIHRSPHLKVGGLGHVRTPSGIHEQPGERGTRTPHHGKAMSEAEQRKAKGRTIQEMGHFSADDGSQSLARMLALLEMVS